MTPNKQVSPAIRILRGERDASARATHLEAATRKFLVTTNERKYMSTKTNFKRIALVAVAALGLGLLSSVPSQAAISSGPTVTTATGTASYSSADSATAATAAVTWTANASETVGVTVFQVSGPKAIAGRLTFTDTATAFTTTSVTYNSSNATHAGTVTSDHALKGSETLVATSATGVNALNFKVQLDTTTSRLNSSGAYVYRINVIGYGAVKELDKVTTADVTITIATPAAESKVASAATSTAYLTTTAANSSATTDLAGGVQALATASTTPRAYIYVNLKNASSAAAYESVTVTTTVGSVGTGSASVGKSIVLAYNAAMDIGVYSDGTAGTASISVSTPSLTFAAKTVTFYASAPKTMVATVATPNLNVGTNADAVRVTALDANGNSYAGALYAYASTAADALIAGSLTTPSLCTWDAGDNRHECTITGSSAGTAKIKVIDASTVALATLTSNEVSVVVNVNAVASVKLSFDKATYAPNERARIYVTPVDAAGKEIGANTFANLLKAGGIGSNAGFSGSSDTLTASTITTSANASSTTGAKAGSAVFTVYMPAAGGTVTISAIGGTALPLAAQVAVSATATVTDSGAAALAAVTALSTTVASLKTLITTLTNLVLKIQKKVKA